MEKLAKNIENLEPMFKARSSEVYDLGDGKVLKLYYDNIPDESVDIELLNITVAFNQGCTPMECFGKVKVMGRNGLIFKKLDGCSLTSLPEKNPLALFKGGKILAELHAMVHKRKSNELRDVRQIALDTLENDEVFSFLSEEERKKASKYISTLPEADNIIHLDFHTDNILCDKDNNQVIDWMTAARGNPLAEVAMMNFLFHEAELFPGSSKMKIFFLQLVRSFIYKGYIKKYEKLTGLKEEDSKKWDIIAFVLRLGIWNIEFERENLQGKIKEFIKDCALI